MKRSLQNKNIYINYRNTLHKLYDNDCPLCPKPTRLIGFL